MSNWRRESAGHTLEEGHRRHHGRDRPSHRSRGRRSGAAEVIQGPSRDDQGWNRLSPNGRVHGLRREYLAGLRWGCNYATRGTGKVNGNTVEFTIVDDGTDAAKAVTAAKDLIGQGYKIIAGTALSGAALQLAPLAEQNKILYISGPAAVDGITGANDYTFRSGRQTFQDVKASTAYLKGAVGKNVVVFAQDIAFGQGNVAAVRRVYADLSRPEGRQRPRPRLGAGLHAVCEAASAEEPRPRVRRVGGRLVAGCFHRARSARRLRSGRQRRHGLGDRVTWPAYGPALGKIKFFTHYSASSPKNVVNDWLVAKMKRRSQVPDLFTPDGFVAAQMIVRALKASTTDVPKMISSLEGWSFTGPKGQQQIRASDHAMLQPMFHAAAAKWGTGSL